MSPIASNVKLTKTLRTVALLAAIALAAALGACSAPPAQEKAQQAQPEPLVVNDTPAPPVPDPEYILVIGDDSWEEYTPGHADLMMLMRLDFEKHLITLVSVPRDTAYVFPDGNTAKLNQMLTNAGPEAQCQAVSDVVGVDVSQYVVVGFDGLQSIVEHFGGLDVDLPYGLTYNFYTKDHPDEVYEAGPQTLTPWRAMALSRARTGYSDTGYQQEMIRQVVDRQMMTRFIELAYDDPAQTDASAGLRGNERAARRPAGLGGRAGKRRRDHRAQHHRPLLRRFPGGSRRPMARARKPRGMESRHEGRRRWRGSSPRRERLERRDGIPGSPRQRHHGDRPGVNLLSTR